MKNMRHNVEQFNSKIGQFTINFEEAQERLDWAKRCNIPEGSEKFKTLVKKEDGNWYVGNELAKDYEEAIDALYRSSPDDNLYQRR